MYRDMRAPKQVNRYYRDTQQGLDEFESILESDFLDYLHPNLVKSMKQLIARRRDAGNH